MSDSQPATKTWRLRALSNDRMVIAETPVNVATLEGVLILQIDQGVNDYRMDALTNTIARVFGDRVFIICPPGVEFVQLLETTP